MTQIEKLRAGKWNHQMATAEEVAQKVEEMRAMVEKYGFGDYPCNPYSFNVKTSEFLGWFEDYGRCTAGSRHQMLAEINGFIPILNHWIEQKEEPQVKIRLLRGNKAGTIKEVGKSLAEDYVDGDLAEYV